MPHLYDMHCHIGFADNAQEVAARGVPNNSPSCHSEGNSPSCHSEGEARRIPAGSSVGDPSPSAQDDINQRFPRGVADGISMLSCTVEPKAYELERLMFDGCGNVAVGLGAHPWWVAGGSITQEDVELLCELAAESTFIGEVGLDFGKSHGVERAWQLEVFGRVARSCMDGGKVLSIHAVNAANEVLDLLEDADALSGNICIFHWFSGSSPQLTRAIKAGCFFSVNAMMLATRRGREYARQIPLERLLLETDWPEAGCGDMDYAAYRDELTHVAQRVEDIRGTGALDTIAATSAEIFAMI